MVYLHDLNFRFDSILKEIRWFSSILVSWMILALDFYTNEIVIQFQYPHIKECVNYKLYFFIFLIWTNVLYPVRAKFVHNCVIPFRIKSSSFVGSELINRPSAMGNKYCNSSAWLTPLNMLKHFKKRSKMKTSQLILSFKR